MEIQPPSRAAGLGRRGKPLPGAGAHQGQALRQEAAPADAAGAADLAERDAALAPALPVVAAAGAVGLRTQSGLGSGPLPRPPPRPLPRP